MLEVTMPGLAFGRRTVSMPADVLERVERRVGSRGFSAYVTEAVRRQLNRDALQEYIDEVEMESGPITEAELSRARQRIEKALAE
jgi:metal-responsive CopG/Arc/MetJ family transcriptional regulator